eukprot:CAMPEP_0198722986 /NCGR_PEP_ID=MMETSP1475-20131203/561_1 /TAXON_ID= ORGANISM="Unidentified sp., Strain CCMP1999" /NCGR_SAMPLE_ID=MMETSP1475 /ASSEMBLY_ACC=CAM_ASM_001111 /LENGTH=118 /DNA_ID=CAMNT_0044483955 /DNA_START=314 /DNA_END=670 /DNA_ORIENTATION=+
MRSLLSSSPASSNFPDEKYERKLLVPVLALAPALREGDGVRGSSGSNSDRLGSTSFDPSSHAARWKILSCSIFRYADCAVIPGTGDPGRTNTEPCTESDTMTAIPLRTTRSPPTDFTA